MKLLSWNPHGLANPWGIQTLEDLLRREEPNVVFLSETKVLATFFDLQKFKFGSPNCFDVSYVEQSGGIALLWKREVEMEILKFSSSFIYGQVVTKISCFVAWLFTRVYGHLEVSKWLDI